jgi:alkylation response protein AidB-like acyl-CoA dehydrogenase
MDFQPSEEQSLIGDTIRRFLAERRDAASIGRGPMPPADWKMLAELGAFHFLLPEEIGGIGAGNQDVMIVAEELGRALAVAPVIESVVLCAGLVARHGTDAQRAAWVEPVLAGERLLSYAGEARITGTADGGWQIGGDCPLVRFGMDAAAYLIVADEVGLIVPAGAPGLSRTPGRMVDGSIAATLRLDDVRLPADSALKISAEALEEGLARARIALAAQLVGAMETLYEATIDYVRQRHQFGVPIARFQVIQHRAARLFIALEQSRSLMLKAALSAENSAEGRRAAAAAHAYVADAALRLAQEATQLHGGMGITDELAVGRGHRIVLLLSHLFGGASGARAALVASPE